jgi:diguanylate cyclase (GGDEF)-like protein/PAS domain S-box-containing protein
MLTSSDTLSGLSDGDLRKLFVQNPMPMWLFEPGSARLLEVNDAALRTYGYSREEFLSKTLYDLQPAEDAPRIAEALVQSAPAAAAEGQRKSSGWRHRRKDGSLMWVDIYDQDFAADGRSIRLAMIHDISDLRHFVDKANEQSAYFRQLFVGSPDAIALLDRSDGIIDVNPAFEALFQYSRSEVLGRRINALVVPPEREAEGAALSALSFNGITDRSESVRRRKDGAVIHVSLMSYPLLIGGEMVGAYAIYQDRSGARKLATELSYQARHDVLTGLINRREFERLASERLAAASNGHRGFAVLHIDLDQFKLVSDSFGTAMSDNLLCETAKLLRDRTRGSDLLARIGTCEFALLLCDLTPMIAEQIAAKLVQAAESQRFDCGGQSWPVQISIGLMNRAKGGSETIADLVSGAAMACRLAAEKGNGHVEVFQASDRDLRRQRDDLMWGTRIADAIAQKRLILYLQRIVPTMTPTEGSRYEVLLRMVDDNGVAMPPGALIAAAERFRMMPVIDRYVIDMALSQIKWARDAGGDLPETISINLSGMSLGSTGLTSYIFDKILQYGVMPGMLCFEITETSAIRNLDVAATFVHDMRNLGCSVALDDFGTGMASLAYLRNFEVDYIKIDGQFIRDLLNNPFDHATVEAMNKLAQLKGSRTVAEFVENEATLLRLQELGVDYVQGYYVHRPEPWAVGSLPRPKQPVLAGTRRAA